MPRIDTIILRSRDPLAQRQFYSNVLGMKEFEDGTVGYGNREARLYFEQVNKRYEPTPRDVYWKIAIAVPNIDLAYQQLVKLDVQINEPRQFQDIGYLTHFTDPEGFTVELIEHEFAGQRKDIALDARLLGGGPHVNLLTLRSIDIEKVKKMCDRWHMTPLSIQTVPEHGFTLYFFAFTNDKPPSTDLSAIENRPWVYQRPYTVLEIQHIQGNTDVVKAEHENAGYACTVITDDTGTFIDKDLSITPRYDYISRQFN